MDTMIDFHGLTGGRRSISTRYFALAPDQARTKGAGCVKSCEGGGIKAEVVEQMVGGRAEKAKHIGLPSYEPFTIQCGMSMSDDFWKWMEASWAGKVARMNGALLAMDANHKVQ